MTEPVAPKPGTTQAIEPPEGAPTPEPPHDAPVGHFPPPARSATARLDAKPAVSPTVVDEVDDAKTRQEAAPPWMSAGPGKTQPGEPPDFLEPHAAPPIAHALVPPGPALLPAPVVTRPAYIGTPYAPMAPPRTGSGGLLIGGLVLLLALLGGAIGIILYLRSADASSGATVTPVGTSPSPAPARIEPTQAPDEPDDRAATEPEVDPPRTAARTPSGSAPRATKPKAGAPATTPPTAPGAAPTTTVGPPPVTNPTPPPTTTPPPAQPTAVPKPTATTPPVATTPPRKGRLGIPVK